MITSLPQVRTGKLRALGVLSTKRYELLPDVQTVAETVAGYEARTWGGVGVPNGTPTDIILRLNREINAGLANPTIRARLADVGTVPMVLTPRRSKPTSPPRLRSGARWYASPASSRSETARHSADIP